MLHIEILIHIEYACYCSKLSLSCTQKWAKNKRAGGDAVIPCNWLLHVIKGATSFPGSFPWLGGGTSRPQVGEKTLGTRLIKGGESFKKVTKINYVQMQLGQ